MATGPTSLRRGMMTRSVVSLSKGTSGNATPKTSTAHPRSKPVPVMVTSSPPARKPSAGVTNAILGTSRRATTAASADAADGASGVSGGSWISGLSGGGLVSEASGDGGGASGWSGGGGAISGLSGGGGAMSGLLGGGGASGFSGGGGDGSWALSALSSIMVLPYRL